MRTLKIGKGRLEQSEVGKQKCYSDSPYSEIITTEATIDWYFSKDGSFDGIGIASEKGFSVLELVLLERVFGVLGVGQGIKLN